MALTFRQFVDDALFHPAWGYYATGAVRFGLGGHYDTYPLALSPVFGRMVARWAARVWRDCGRPSTFELCEIGAGNGQLAVDVLVDVAAMARRRRDWRAFDRALRYRILERSPALAARQARQLGPLAARVAWTRGDLARRVPAGAPFAACGAVFGNEVLDCFAPERVVPTGDGRPRATVVVPREGRRVLSRAALAAALADPRRRRGLRFHERLVPIAQVPGLAPFVRRHYPEFFRPGRRWPPYFACPQVAPFLRHMGRLYPRAEAILIDYGGGRELHLATPERRRLVVGPPRSGGSLYRAPGRDDVTVLVDFSLVATEAVRAGWAVADYADQGALARYAGVRLDARTVELIVRARAVNWVLALVGAEPEDRWRRGAIGFGPRPTTGSGERLAETVRRDVAEFRGPPPTRFKLVRLTRGTA